MADVDEIMQTVEHLEREFTDLAMRGLRASGAAHLGSLEALQEEFERIGAAHLASSIGEVIGAIRNDDRSAAASLLRAQTSLTVLERILTLEVSAAELEQFSEASGGSEDDEDVV